MSYKHQTLTAPALEQSIWLFLLPCLPSELKLFNQSNKCYMLAAVLDDHCSQLKVPFTCNNLFGSASDSKRWNSAVWIIKLASSFLAFFSTQKSFVPGRYVENPWMSLSLPQLCTVVGLSRLPSSQRSFQASSGEVMDLDTGGWWCAWLMGSVNSRDREVRRCAKCAQNLSGVFSQVTGSIFARESLMRLSLRWIYMLFCREVDEDAFLIRWEHSMSDLLLFPTLRIGGSLPS